MTACTCRMCRARRQRALVRWTLHLAFTCAVGVGAFFVLVGLDRMRAGITLVLSAIAMMLHEAIRILEGDARR